MDVLLQRVKRDPLARVNEGPMAPHAETPQELAQQVRIGVLGGGGQSPLFNEPSVASGVSLMETGNRIGVDLKNTFEATLVSENKKGMPTGPNLNMPPPSDGDWSAARTQFHNTKVNDIELRLRKLWPKPVILERHPIQTADMYLKADEVLPKDPTVDTMLHHFNEKYGVFDDKGVPSMLPEPPNSDLLPRNKENLTKVARDYVDVYDGANKFGFDPTKDSVEQLDKMLGSMWTKRWEYFATEKASAEAREKARTPDPNVPPTYEIDPLFAVRQPNPNNKEEAILGNVYTYVDTPRRGEPIPFIDPRPNHKPEFSFYGPSRITAKAKLASGVAPPAGPEFIKPEYNGPNVPTKHTIKLIPEVPAPVAVGVTEWMTPSVKGDDFASMSASPAKILPGLQKLLKQEAKKKQI